MKKIDFLKIYSHSKLSRFEKCPLDYYFYYLDPKWKGYQEPKDYNTKGSAIHGALTLFYNLPLKKRNARSLQNSLLEAWFSETDKTKKPPLGEIGGFNTKEDEKKTYRESLEILQKFLDLKDINPPIFYIPTEDIKNSFCDYEKMIQPIDDQSFISGKFDRIDKIKDDTLRIIDFKTGKKQNSKDQLDFYRVLAELNFKIPVSIVSFYYLKEGEIVDFKTSNVDFEEIKKITLERVKKIREADKFPPRPSKLCNYCDFKNKDCPIYKNKKKK
jgi:RecB family exonuclease